MRILQLSKFYPPAPGGIESFVRDLSHALVAEGHENTVLAHTFQPSESLNISGDMGRVIRVPSYGQIMYAPLAPAYPFHLHRLLKDFKPDMLLVHMPNVSGFWPLFMSLPCPLTVFWHSDVIFPKSEKLLNTAYKGYGFFENRLLRKARRIIATSPPYLETSQSLTPFHDKCEVIPLGISPDRIPDVPKETVAAVKRAYFGNADAQYVFAAGRFAHYKGFDRLVKAAAVIRESDPDLMFIIAGEGETRPAIRNRIRSEGMTNRVLCPGYVPDEEYWALMQGCEFFCLPSVERTEAFGVVLLEAMSKGKPCLSTAIPGSGTGWVNRNNETGLVASPGDTKELAQAISSMRQTAWNTDSIRQHAARFDISVAAQRIAIP